jgi:molybdopterin-guanine dinucleotide biosynthesis protein A
MPFINPVLVKHISNRWSGNFDAAIPIYEKKPQPLFGIYSRRIAEKMEESIKNGERSLKRFLRFINVLYIDEEEVSYIDPGGRSFININTMEDFQREIGGKTCLV